MKVDKRKHCIVLVEARSCFLLIDRKKKNSLYLHLKKFKMQGRRQDTFNQNSQAHDTALAIRLVSWFGLFN